MHLQITKAHFQFISAYIITRKMARKYKIAIFTNFSLCNYCPVVWCGRAHTSCANPLNIIKCILQQDTVF